MYTYRYQPTIGRGIYFIPSLSRVSWTILKFESLLFEQPIKLVAIINLAHRPRISPAQKKIGKFLGVAKTK